MTLRKRTRILPYRQGSRSAKAVSEALGGRVLKLEGSKFTPREHDLIINWGYTGDFHFGLAGWVNDPSDVRQASNKLLFFKTMEERSLADIVPPFWTDGTEIPEDAFPVVCRTVLSGHSGEGIVIANSQDELVSAPLYVKYIKKAQEYRVHLGVKDGEPVVISLQRKARRYATPDSEVNWKVRSHQNGFVFVREDVSPPEGVLEVARKALEATSLDFGAVDVIWNEQKGRAYVLEINTAPGLEGTTVEDYKKFFAETVPQ